jgi:hypothetical protein
MLECNKVFGYNERRIRWSARRASGVRQPLHLTRVWGRAG